MNKVVMFTPWDMTQPLNRTALQIEYHHCKILQQVLTVMTESRSVVCRGHVGNRAVCMRKDICGAKEVFPVMIGMVVTQSYTCPIGQWG